MALPTRQALFVTFLLLACARQRPCPCEALPQGADLYIFLAPPTQIRPQALKIFERWPEVRGVSDLLRSLVGLSLDDDAEAYRNGLDPNRGVALAASPDRLFLVLPVDDSRLAERRLRLRLARFGFLSDGPDPMGRFRFRLDGEDPDAPPSAKDSSLPRATATLLVQDSLAFICVGFGDLCLSQTAGAGFDPSPLKTEIGLEDPVMVGVLKGPGVFKLAEAVGLNVQDRAVATALALLQDLRFALSLRGGIEFRGLLGPSGPPLPPFEPSTPLPLGAIVQIALPDGLRALLASQAQALPPSLRPIIAAWSGKAALEVKAAPSSRPALSPLIRPDRLIEALDLSYAVSFLSPEGANMAFLALQQQPFSAFLRNSPPKLEGNVIFGSSGPSDPSAILKDLPVEPIFFRLLVSPHGMASLLNLDAIDFVRHMTSAVNVLEFFLAFESGRFVLGLRALIS